MALRIVGLNEDVQFRQQPAYETDKRIHVSLESVVFKNEASDFFGKTIFKVNFEHGQIAGTPVNVIPPEDGVSNWFEQQIPNRSVIEAMSGVTLPGYIDNTFDEGRGVFVPKTIINTLPGAKLSKYGFNNRLAAWVNIPLTWNHPDQVIPSVGLPGQPEVAGVLGRVIWNKTPQYGRGRFETPMSISDYFSGAIPGFIGPRVPQSMLDNETILYSGKTSHVEHDFDAKNFALEQSLFNGKGGIELVYDVQTYERESLIGFNNDWRIDTVSHLTNDQPNPNVGKLLAWGGADPQYASTWREATRFTAFYDLDFTEKEGLLGWMGRHVFTGLYNEQTIDRLDRSYRFIWDHVTSPKTAADIFTGNQTGGRRRMWMYNYLTPSLLNSQLSDIKITNWIEPQMPTDGSTYYLSWNDHPKPSVNPDGINIPADPTTYVPGTGDPSFYDTFRATKQLTSAFRNKQVITSEALSWQSRWLDNNVIGLLGWRKDKSVNTGQASVGKDADGNPLPEQQELSGTSEIAEGSTLTKSLVLHLPVDLGSTSISAHYNTSENFSPAATRRSIRGDILPSPLGETEEIGIGIEFLDGAVSLRISKYEMISDYVDANLGGAITGILAPLGAVRWGQMSQEQSWEDVFAIMYDDRGRFSEATRFGSYDELFTALSNYLPRDVEGLINRRYVDGTYEYDRILGAAATRSFTSEGTEVELIGNLTQNWRIAVNVGQQETVTANSAPILSEVAQQVVEGYKREGLWDHQDAPDNDADATFRSRFNGATLIPIAKAQAADGTVSLEQREWRANFATNYDFHEGTLKGFGIGGSYRYQSQVATGYEQEVNADGVVLPILSKPHWGPSEWNGDIWLSYKRPLTDKIDWKVQLNIRNILGDDDLIPVVTNPDGRVAALRNSNPRDTFITSTFSF